MAGRSASTTRMPCRPPIVDDPFAGATCCSGCVGPPFRHFGLLSPGNRFLACPPDSVKAPTHDLSRTAVPKIAAAPSPAVDRTEAR